MTKRAVRTSRTSLAVLALLVGLRTGCGRSVSDDPLRSAPATGTGGAGSGRTGSSGAGTTGSGGIAGSGASESDRGASGGRPAADPGAGGGGEPSSGGGAGAASGSGDPGGGAGGVAQGGAPDGAGQAGDDAGSAGEGAGQGGGPPVSGCDERDPFGPPERVPGLPDGAIRLRLRADETIGFYALWLQTSSYDLVVAHRDSRHEPFAAGTKLDINDAAWDFSPSPTGDGSILYFESPRTNQWRIHQSVRQPNSAEFGTIALAPGLGAATSPHSDGGPYVTPSASAIYFHTNRAGRPTLARAEWTGSTFGQPEIFEFGALTSQAYPVVSPDELTLYFTVMNGPTNDNAHGDVWRATRTSKDEPFANPTEVREVNTNDHEIPSFISQDGCRLYFDRVVGTPFGWATGPEDAYVAEREPRTD